MTDIAEPCFAPNRLAIELGLRIGGRSMGSVLALLAVEIRAVVAALLCDAKASIRVLSTEKCSSDNNGLTLGFVKSSRMNF